MSKFFSKPEPFRLIVNVELDLPNCEIKTDLKNARAVSNFAEKTNLSNSKSDVDKLVIDKLKNVPSNLSNLKCKVYKLDIGELQINSNDLGKLSNVVKTDVVKKTEYNELVKEVNNVNTTDTSILVKKLTLTQILMELERGLLIMIIAISMLLHKKSII